METKPMRKKGRNDVPDISEKFPDFPSLKDRGERDEDLVAAEARMMDSICSNQTFAQSTERRTGEGYHARFKPGIDYEDYSLRVAYKGLENIRH